MCLCACVCVSVTMSIRTITKKDWLHTNSTHDDVTCSKGMSNFEIVISNSVETNTYCHDLWLSGHLDTFKFRFERLSDVETRNRFRELQTNKCYVTDKFNFISDL